MMRKTSIILLSAATGAALTLFVTQPRAVFMGTSARAATSDTYRQLNLFGDVFERVRSDYVEKPDDSKLIESAINGMLSSLDPHSAFLNRKHFNDMQVQTRGEFGGLGIEVTMENNIVKVVAPIDDTPAARAGVMANDLITHLDGDQIVGLTLEQAVEKMRGKVGTAITLTIQRKGNDEPLELKIVRDRIRINAVRARAEKDVAYIRITTFNEQTHANLVSSVERLKKEIGPSLKGYIIDLRNNPGGLLDQAIAPGAIGYFQHANSGDSAADADIFDRLHRGASSIAKVTTVPWPSRDLLLIAMAAHNLVLLTDPMLDRAFARRGLLLAVRELPVRAGIQILAQFRDRRPVRGIEVGAPARDRGAQVRRVGARRMCRGVDG